LITQLDGYELPAAAWETEVLASRTEEYDPALLDTLCMMGRVTWGRLAPQRSALRVERGGGTVVPIRSTPIGLMLREHAPAWLAHRNGEEYQLSSYAARVKEVLEQRGASFFPELVAVSGLLPTQVEQGLGELAGVGLVTSDSFAGLRALITPSSKRKPLSSARRRHRTAPHGIESAGRWALLSGEDSSAPTIELAARTYLRRYGIVFKRVLARESGAPAWRDLLMFYRRLEARGEIRGGRFVTGMSGEQFALPEAVGQLRSIRRLGGGGQLLSISGADPLNLTGTITPGDRVPGLTTNRILYRDGVPILARDAGQTRWLIQDEGAPSAELIHALVRKQSTPALRGYFGLSGAPAATVPLNRPPNRNRKKRRTTGEPVAN